MGKNRRTIKKGHEAPGSMEAPRMRVCVAALIRVTMAVSIIAAAMPAYSLTPGYGPGVVQKASMESGVTEDERAMLYDVYSGFLASGTGTYRTETYYPAMQWENWPRALEVCYFHSVRPGVMKLYSDTSHAGEYQVAVERTEDMNAIRQRETEYNTLVAQIAAQAEEKTPEEKVRFFHDYITQKCSYDYTHTRSRAYDCLVDGLSVCNGYATAFYNLCSAAGLEVNYIAGTVEVEGQGRIAHAWNRVKGSDGQWLYYDLTFDDTLGNDRYYGLTEGEMSQDHFPKEMV